MVCISVTQRTNEDCQRNSPRLTPSQSAPPVPTSAVENTASSLPPVVIIGFVLGIIVLLGVIVPVSFFTQFREWPHSKLVKPSSSCPQKIHDTEATVTSPTLPITNLRSEPLPPPDDPRDSKSNFFSGLNAIPTASSSRIDNDYDVIPTVTDVQNEKAKELTHLGSMTLDGTQGPSRYDKANEARMNRVIAPARGSSMMVVTSGVLQRPRNNVASWSCEDVEDWLLRTALRAPISPGVGVSAAGSMTVANDAPPQYS
ncbi:hypothetical protein BC829DRAFT_449407 [Chytridium lagenaria]|nr:hypothetical protein BC829DRAFT_449407 [Chytridium lagenaria]